MTFNLFNEMKLKVILIFLVLFFGIGIYIVVKQVCSPLISSKSETSKNIAISSIREDHQKLTPDKESQFDDLNPQARNKEIIKYKTSDTANVKDFGAVGDGVKDDYLSFQKAINSLKNSNAILIIPKGNYILSRKLDVLRSNFQVLGEPNSKLIFTNENCDKPGNGFVNCKLGIHVGKNLSNISISGITVKGFTTNQIVSYGISVWDFTDGVTIKKCKLEGFSGGILFNRRNKDILIENCSFKDMIFVPLTKGGGYGVVFQSSSNSLMQYNVFESSVYRHAVYYARNQFHTNEAGFNHVFKNNTVYGSDQKNYQTGFELSFKILGNSNVDVINNEFRGGVGHIWIVQNDKGTSKVPQNIKILNNRFSDIKNTKISRVYAIGVDGDSNVENLLIKNNIFSNNKVDNLIKLQKGKDIEILNNKISNLEEGHFINVTFGITSLSIINNIVESMNPEYDGIYIGSENKDLKYFTTGTIKDNTIKTALFSFYSNNFVKGLIVNNTFSSKNTSVYFAKGKFEGEIADNKFFNGRGIFDAVENKSKSFTNNQLNGRIIK